MLYNHLIKKSWSYKSLIMSAQHVLYIHLLEYTGIHKQETRHSLIQRRIIARLAVAEA